eukprot:4797186-Ditylum_brightwellii.AAC.1
MSSLSSQDMARSVVKTKDNQQSQPQVPKQEAMKQVIQADLVQSSSVMGEDTTVQTINRKSHCHITTLSHHQQKGFWRQHGRETMNI